MDQNATQQTAQPVFLKIEEVRARTSMSTSAIYERMTAGVFPRPVGLGLGAGKRWIEQEIDAWVIARIAERDAAANGK